ncbi:MAG: GtrA family protein [Acidobacteriaceae bacterium]|nr:GtrA family protein [Acidobacteriaceae bacterium]
MSLTQRLLRFNAVGILGAALQLGLLALLRHVFHVNYLLATAIAIDVTLIHNFLWHRKVTWPEQTHGPTAFFRFHLSNGLISLLGNLLLMRFFVGHLHLPVVLSNLIAIVLCSVINFTLGHSWVFTSTKPCASHVSC